MFTLASLRSRGPRIGYQIQLDLSHISRDAYEPTSGTSGTLSSSQDRIMELIRECVMEYGHLRLVRVNLTVQKQKHYRSEGKVTTE